MKVSFGLPYTISAGVFGMTFAASSFGAILRVDAAAPGGGNGASWGTAYNNLTSTIALAAGGDEIWVKAGTYKPAGGGRYDSFTLKSGVKIYGGFAGTEFSLAHRDPIANVTILSGDNTASLTDNCFHVVTGIGTLTALTKLDGFTIKGGRADDIRAVEINGGGLYLEATGSGVNSCLPVIARCIFVDNTASNNGAATFMLGGGMVALTCEPQFVSCSFVGNGAGNDGGGAAAQGANATFMNSIFSGNTAASEGGGLASIGSGTSVALFNCTVSANAAITTGGVAPVTAFSSTGSVTIVNSVLWGNTGSATVEVAQITAGGTGDSVDFTCVQGLSTITGTGNIGSNPSYLDANGTDNVTGTLDDIPGLRLALASPCNDVASDSAILPDVADLDYDANLGESTPFDLTAATLRRSRAPAAGVLGVCDGVVVDMGAFENGDCDGDATRDEDEVDSNNDGIPDDCQDCNGNDVLDLLELAENDCNMNGRLDECDISLGCSSDINASGVPDECECGLDIVFVIDHSNSIAGTGSDEQEMLPICTMMAQIEASLPPFPFVSLTKIAVICPCSPAGTDPGCLTQDLHDVTGFTDEASASCSGPIGDEDWINAIEVLSDQYPWRAASTKRVIVAISDEGGCLGGTCSASHAAIVAAITRANVAGCDVYPIVGYFPDACAPVAASAIASGTGGVTWSVSALTDYDGTGGIGDQLSEILIGQLSSCIGQCPADFTGDGVVDAADLAILLGAWGTCAPPCAPDLDASGGVDAADLAILLGAWGPCSLDTGGEEMSGQNGGDDIWESQLNPAQLAVVLGFSSVAELASYLGSLDFETMQTLLEAYFAN